MWYSYALINFPQVPESLDSSRSASPTIQILTVRDNFVLWRAIILGPSWGAADDEHSRPDIGTASIGMWGAVHSLLGIFCCCAPVYGIFQPYRVWGRLVSVIQRCDQETKRMRPDPALQPGPWQDVPLDQYFQGEDWFIIKDGRNRSTQGLVTGDVWHGAPCGNATLKVSRGLDTGRQTCKWR